VRLAALMVGAGVPGGDFSGRVLEVHARACLIAVSDEICVTLAAAVLGGLPCGIVLGTPSGFFFSSVLGPGAEAAARGGILRIGGGALAVDLRAARTWRSELPALNLDLSRPASRATWVALAAAVLADGRADALRHCASAAISALTAATRARNAAAARHAMSRLIGLGEGRTPAGDDYLVGYAAGLQACGRAGPPAAFTAALLAGLRTLARETNRVSRLYLEAAATGEISQRLHRVATAVASGADRAEGERALADALAVGHSSGAAGVLGLLHGSAAACGLLLEAGTGAAGSAAPGGA
jgi:hypothetical protein